MVRFSMRFTHTLATLSLALLTAACSSPLKVTKLDDTQSISKQPKVLSLLTKTEYDADIRIALAQHGFKTKKYASTKKVFKDVNPTTSESYRKASTRFGLSVYPGRIVDFCTINSGVQLGRATFEVSDLSTNESLLFIQAGGWTEACAYHNDIVWDKLSNALANNWK